MLPSSHGSRPLEHHRKMSHWSISAYYLVLRRKYSKLHLANSLAGKTKAAFCHATTASQSKLVFTDQQIASIPVVVGENKHIFSFQNGNTTVWPKRGCSGQSQFASASLIRDTVSKQQQVQVPHFLWEQQYKEAELLDVAHRRIIGPERNSIEGTTTRRQEGM